MSCEQQNEISSTPKVVWVVNPFDQLPNETDLPLRYWTLCRVLAEQGNEVIWWSSDFSHLTKTKRRPCPDTDGFAVRLIETPPYTKNISIARLRNHKAFGVGFYKNAITGLKNGSNGGFVTTITLSAGLIDHSARQAMDRLVVAKFNKRPHLFRGSQMVDQQRRTVTPFLFSCFGALSPR